MVTSKRRVAALICALLPCWCSAGEPREPGFNELLIVEPGAQEDGLPSAIIEGGHVQIPPTLHIHPYYYSGDKEYQGPIINGGPTIIVANHPKTGEKLYIEAVLPQGAPIIAYSATTITYIYQNRRVVIEFKHLLKHRACVSYVSGRGIFRTTEEHIDEGLDGFHAMKRKSKLASELGELHKDTGNLVKGGCGMASAAGATVVERVRALTKVVPGVQALQSAGERLEESGAKEEIRQAGLEQAENARKFLPTNR